jgi:C-terminal processing protease CtpA/Prc
MKSQLTTLIIALLAGYFAGYLGSNKTPAETSTDTSVKVQTDHSNPFQTHAEPVDLIYKIDTLQLKVEELEKQINALQKNQEKLAENNTHSSGNQPNNKNTQTKTPSGSPNKKNMIASGVNPDMADDILRRISQQDYRRLELQNLIRHADPATRREYRNELRELNKNKLSLRSEIGEDSYDRYLFVSGRNNRVKVRSVMTGSPAESSGLLADDVILSYNDQKILSWPDIRAATMQAEIGSYINIEILRDGTVMNMTIPGGTLGVQLDALQVEP